MAVGCNGMHSSFHVLLEEYDSERARLSRENRLMKARLNKPRKRGHERQVSWDNFTEAEKSPQNNGESSHNGDGGVQVVTFQATQQEEEAFSLGVQWCDVDVRLSTVENTHPQANFSGFSLSGDMEEQGRRRATQSRFMRTISAARKFRLPMNPNSPPRLCWDAVGLLLISWDIIAIPLQVGFNPPEMWLTIGMGWTTLVYWTLDMLMSNLVGFYEEGELVMNQKRITLKYLKSWFIIDVVVVVPDWFIRIVAMLSAGREEGGLAEVANILKSVRGIRVIRLLRLLKLQRLMNLVYDFLDSEYVFICFTLLKLTALIAILNHVIACVWYLVGHMTYEQGELNWLENTGINRVIDGDLAWKYTTALHWSLTQFTPASMDVVARNVPERIVSIVVVFFALIGFSSIVGSVTNSMTQLRNLQGDRKQFWLLRKYLNEQQIYDPTRTRLFQFLEHTVEAKRKAVKSDDIRILGLLSMPLQNLLAYELHKQPLEGHPFFALLEAEMQPVMFRFCHSALRFINYAREDTCFEDGEEGKWMWFVNSGTFCYMQKGAETVTLGVGEWLAEPVLWTTSWWHRGELQAAGAGSEMSYIAPADFANCVRVHPRPWQYARNYAIQFKDFLNSSDTKAYGDIMRIDPAIHARMVEASDVPTSEGDDA